MMLTAVLLLRLLPGAFDDADDLAAASTGSAALRGAALSARQHTRGFLRRAAHRASLPVLSRASLLAAVPELPDEVDWSVNATTPVRDQGCVKGQTPLCKCQSSWAFATIAGVESAIFNATGVLPPPLSTEELVSCDRSGRGNFGCDGGDIVAAVDFLLHKDTSGVTTNAIFPDTSSSTGERGACTAKDWVNIRTHSVANVTKFEYALDACTTGDCSQQDEETLARALVRHGPISICINSGDAQTGDWTKYPLPGRDTQQILGGKCFGNSDEKECFAKMCGAKANLVDHCVQLVGFNRVHQSATGTPTPYWKVRNSWGTAWGQSGFIEIPYGMGNNCCVACEAIVITAVNITEPEPPNATLAQHS